LGSLNLSTRTTPASVNSLDAEKNKLALLWNRGGGDERGQVAEIRRNMLHFFQKT